jgi:RNAse (barnase) inhibitor barstar
VVLLDNLKFIAGNIMRKEFVLDGNNFNNLEEFYNEVDKLFTKNLTWKTGHNFDAFNDLLCGGFGAHEYGEPIKIKWINYQKSLVDFGYKATELYYEGLLVKCHSDNIENIKNKLHAAKNHTGETLIYIIVKIIIDNDDSGHDCILETID